MRRTIFLLCLAVFSAPALAEVLVPDDADTEAGRPRCRDCSVARPAKKNVEDVIRTTSKCDVAAYTAAARRIGAPDQSSGNCLPSVREALHAGGCPTPPGFAMNAMQAFAAAKRGGWSCRSGGTAAAAPEGAVIFSQGCGSHHTEIKSRNCYWSDFHDSRCKASSEYSGCKYRQLGWCLP